MRKIVLASASPRRRKLLKQINMHFQIAPQGISETVQSSIPPNAFAIEIARKKAESAAPSFPQALIIGSDTIVVHEGEILGKPANENEAFSMLSQLSGNTHTVITGVALLLTDKQGQIISKHTFSEHTHVTFATLEDDEIQKYIKTGSPMDKAGSYGIQEDWGSVFVSKIEGDYFNVVGFPLHKFYQAIKKFAPEYLPFGPANILQ